MDSSYSCRELYLSSAFELDELKSFLQENDLDFEEDTDCAAGVFDDGEKLVACGCCAGSVLKQFAVESRHRGENLLGSVLSLLLQKQFARGRDHLFVYTKPSSAAFFRHSGFTSLASTSAVELLENLPDGPERFARRHARPGREGVKAGAVVMNANPFTLGHRFLAERASALCDLLYVFVVEEDRSVFPFAARLAMVREGLRDLGNAVVCPSGPYMISSATFPAYFIKEKNRVQDIFTELDVTLFAERIAPLFGIEVRFAGTEPSCETTRQYNAFMRSFLPRRGIAFHEMERFATDSGPVSASTARKLLAEHGPEHPSLARLLPESTLNWLAGEEAKPVLQTLSADFRPC